jgi:hypothetical protein
MGIERRWKPPKQTPHNPQRDPQKETPEAISNGGMVKGTLA